MLCKESPTLKGNTQTSVNMVDQVSNLDIIMPEGVRTFSLSDEGVIGLSTPNIHSESFVPVRHLYNQNSLTKRPFTLKGTTF